MDHVRSNYWRPEGVVAGLIALLAIVIAYGAHLPGNVKATIAIVGILIALLVREALVRRAAAAPPSAHDDGQDEEQGRSARNDER